MRYNLLELATIIMFFISFYGLITTKNAIKSIIYISLMEISVIMFFLGLGYAKGAVPPIGSELENAIDPLPQALMITAIVIGVAVTAVNLTILISLLRQSKSADWETVQNKSMEL